MLQLFKNNQLFTAFLLALYLLIFHGAVWFGDLGVDSSAYSKTAGLFSQWVYELIGKEGTLPRIIFFVLVLVQALTLNGIVNEHRLAKRHTYITGVAYVLVNFTFAESAGLSPVVMSNTFLLLALASLYATYEKKVSMAYVFNVGFWVAIATMFYFSAGTYFFLALGGFIILRPFDIREILILVSGFLVPFFLLGTYSYVFADLGIWWQEAVTSHFTTRSSNLDFDLLLYFGLGLYCLLLLWSLVNTQNLYTKTTIRQQKYLNIIFLMIFVGCLSFFVQGAVFPQHFALLVIPLAMFLSLNLQSLKSQSGGELVHLVVFLSCFAVQYRFLVLR